MPMTDDDIRALARINGIRETAIEIDVLGQFPNDGKQSFRDWYAGIKAEKPTWAEPEVEAPGEELYSIKGQTEYVRQHGAAAASAHLAKHGLKLGFVTKRPKQKDSGNDGVAASTNPYSKNFKGTAAERDARRLAIIRQSTSLARKLAASENLRIDGGPLLRRVV